MKEQLLAELKELTEYVSDTYGDFEMCIRDRIGRMSRFWHISIIITWLCRLYMIGKMASYAERILGQQGNGQEVQRMPGAKSMRLTAP